VLDRFHITMHLNQAVDQVRRAETGRLRGRPLADKLKHLRWKLLRAAAECAGEPSRDSAGCCAVSWLLQSLDAQANLPGLLALPLLTWAAAFLDVWCTRALRSRIEPMKKVARIVARS